MDCEIPHRLERSTKYFYKGLKIYPQQTRYKNLGEKLESESTKSTMSISGGFGLLQLVSEPDSGVLVRMLSPKRKWTPVGVPSRMLGLERGEHRSMCYRGSWTLKGVDRERSHIDWREE